MPDVYQIITDVAKQLNELDETHDYVLYVRSKLDVPLAAVSVCNGNNKVARYIATELIAKIDAQLETPVPPEPTNTDDSRVP